MTVNYEYYTDTYGGTQLQLDEWAYYSNKAIYRIGYLTFNKAVFEFAEYTDAISQAVCSVAEQFRNYELKLQATQKSDLQTLTRGVKSETVKSHSKSYELSKADIETQLMNENNQLIAKTVRQYLLTTGLLYRGL